MIQREVGAFGFELDQGAFAGAAEQWRLGRFEEAAAWGVKAAARPNAHAHILAIAAYSLALAGSLDEARTYAATIRRALPRYSVADFSMHFDSIRKARPCSEKAPSA
jgi:hypothetical protein